MPSDGQTAQFTMPSRLWAVLMVIQILFRAFSQERKAAAIVLGLFPILQAVGFGSLRTKSSSHWGSSTLSGRTRNPVRRRA